MISSQLAVNNIILAVRAFMFAVDRIMFPIWSSINAVNNFIVTVDKFIFAVTKFMLEVKR